MHVIIIGAGAVGLHIARHLLGEGHDVVMVDEDEDSLAHVTEHLDVQTIVGNGAHPDILAKAGAAKADTLIAVARQDEVNMVAAQMAWSLHRTPQKIVRVRDASYLALMESHVYSDDNMPIDLLISPEREVAEALVRAIKVPGAYEVNEMAGGRLVQVAAHVAAEAEIIDMPLEEVEEQYGINFHILAIFRGERLVVPRSSDHLEAGDKFYMICAPEVLPEFMALAGYGPQENKEALLVGGGKVGMEMCRRLEEEGYRVRVIESDKTRAHYLTEDLSQTTVLYGDGLDRNLLIQENAAHMGVVAYVTSNDAVNMLGTVLAKEIGAKDVFTLVSNPNYTHLAEFMQLDNSICPQEITAARILQSVRGTQVKSLHAVRDDEAEVMEIEVSQDSPMIGMPVKDMVLPDFCRVAATIGADGVKLYRDNPVVRPGDVVVIFALSRQAKKLRQIF